MTGCALLLPSASRGRFMQEAHRVRSFIIYTAAYQECIRPDGRLPGLLLESDRINRQDCCWRAELWTDTFLVATEEVVILVEGHSDTLHWLRNLKMLSNVTKKENYSWENFLKFLTVSFRWWQALTKDTKFSSWSKKLRHIKTLKQYILRSADGKFYPGSKSTAIICAQYTVFPL